MKSLRVLSPINTSNPCFSPDVIHERPKLKLFEPDQLKTRPELQGQSQTCKSARPLPLAMDFASFQVMTNGDRGQRQILKKLEKSVQNNDIEFLLDRPPKTLRRKILPQILEPKQVLSSDRMLARFQENFKNDSNQQNYSQHTKQTVGNEDSDQPQRVQTAVRLKTGNKVVRITQDDVDDDCISQDTPQHEQFLQIPTLRLTQPSQKKKSEASTPNTQTYVLDDGESSTARSSHHFSVGDRVKLQSQARRFTNVDRLKVNQLMNNFTDNQVLTQTMRRKEESLRLDGCTKLPSDIFATQGIEHNRSFKSQMRQSCHHLVASTIHQPVYRTEQTVETTENSPVKEIEIFEDDSPKGIIPQLTIVSFAPNLTPNHKSTKSLMINGFSQIYSKNSNKDSKNEVNTPNQKQAKEFWLPMNDSRVGQNKPTHRRDGTVANKLLDKLSSQQDQSKKSLKNFAQTMQFIEKNKRPILKPEVTKRSFDQFLPDLALFKKNEILLNQKGDSCQKKQVDQLLKLLPDSTGNDDQWFGVEQNNLSLPKCDNMFVKHKKWATSIQEFSTHKI